MTSEQLKKANDINSAIKDYESKSSAMDTLLHNTKNEPLCIFEIKYNNGNGKQAEYKLMQSIAIEMITKQKEWYDSQVKDLQKQFDKL